MVKKNLSWRLLVGLLIIASFASCSWFGSGGERPIGVYDEFAQCLYDSGMRMYGSATCSFCARQRNLFGDSFEYVKEIECDPRNPNSEAERCIAKNISKTPTWVLEDVDGNDVYRFDAGVVSLEKLSEVSGCPLPGDSDNL